MAHGLHCSSARGIFPDPGSDSEPPGKPSVYLYVFIYLLAPVLVAALQDLGSSLGLVGSLVAALGCTGRPGSPSPAIMRHFIKQVMGHPGGGRGALLGGPCPGGGGASSAQELAAVGEMLAPWGPRQYPPTVRMLQPLQPACGGGTSDGSRGASAWSPESFPVTRPLPGHRKPRQAAECSPLQGLLDSAFMGPEPLPSFGSEAKEEGRGVCAQSVDRAACPAFLLLCPGDVGCGG